MGGRSLRRRLLERTGWVVGGGLLLLGPLWGRAAWEGQAELDAAATAQEIEDVDTEIAHLGRAARWRLPLASHDDVALARLMELGEAQEARGSAGRQTALAAYREVRRAIISTRSWGVPRSALLDDANRRIAALMAAQEELYGTDIHGKDDPEGEHYRQLSALPGPDPMRANLTALAFLGWLVAGVGFVTRGLGARGALRPRPALIWGGISVVCLVGWMVLLRQAG